MTDLSGFGAIAQLVEHLHGMQGVSGSNPLGSTYFLSHSNGLQRRFRKGITLYLLVQAYLLNFAP